MRARPFACVRTDATRTSITVHAFTCDALVDEICRESIDRGEEVPEQVKYLARYAKRLGARTFVVEAHYIDRHYVDEYAFYYCRMLAPPSNAVRRVHFFASEFSKESFAAMLEESLGSKGARKKVEKRLTAPVNGSSIGGYLGFSSIRPLSRSSCQPSHRALAAARLGRRQPASHLGDQLEHVVPPCQPSPARRRTRLPTAGRRRRCVRDGRTCGAHSFASLVRTGCGRRPRRRFRTPPCTPTSRSSSAACPRTRD